MIIITVTVVIMISVEGDRHAKGTSQAIRDSRWEARLHRLVSINTHREESWGAHVRIA